MSLTPNLKMFYAKIFDNNCRSKTRQSNKTYHINCMATKIDIKELISKWPKSID